MCVFVCVISTDYYFTSFCLIKSLSSFIHQNSSLSIKLMKQQVTEVTDVLSPQPWGNVETNGLHVNCTLFLIWQTIIINWWSVGHIWIVKLFCFGVLCLLHSSFTTGPLPCSAQNGSNEYSWKQLLQVDLSVYHTCQNGILRFTYRNLPISWHPFLTEEILFIISQWIIQTFHLDVGTRIISIKVIKKKSVSLIPHKLSLRSQEWTQTFDSVIGITVVSL